VSPPDEKRELWVERYCVAKASRIASIVCPSQTLRRSLILECIRSVPARRVAISESTCPVRARHLAI